MHHDPSRPARPIRVHETAIDPGDSPQRYREKLARITLDSMVQFVGLLDARGTVLEINKVALDAVGITLADVEGKPFWTTFWWQVSDEIRSGLRDALARAAKGEFVRWDTPIFGRAGGAETIVIDASLCPVFDANGVVVFIAAEGRDITQKKEYEVEIARKNADLQALLARIEELDEIKTQFFANVSHELRTPLALILGPAERLLAVDAPLDAAERTEHAQVIVRNARMLLKHVTDLLDVSKLEAGKMRIELHDADVAGLLRFVASHFEVLAADRRVELRVEAPPSLVAAIDVEKVQRIVMNLLSNAFKFVPDGGTVGCSLRVEGRRLRLQVEDSGPGVKPELRSAIFERFRQGHGAANRRTSGTGLGLAIAHEFAAMHKGDIEVTDSDLGGAKFSVSLPFANREPAGDGAPAAQFEAAPDRAVLDGLLEELRLAAVQGAAGTSAARVSAAGMKPKVLVVEDNLDMNRFVSQSLAAEYEVVAAFDGQQGFDLAVAHRPAAIVSDIMMPGVSGEELVARLRALPELDETPILLLTAKADEELKNRLLATGAQDFVAKPFTERELSVRLRNLVAAAESRRGLRVAEAARREVAEASNRDAIARMQMLRDLFQQTPSFMAVLRGKDHVFELANAAYLQLVGHREVLGKPLAAALPEIATQGFVGILDRVLSTGEPHLGKGVPVRLQRHPDSPLEERFLDFVYQPLVSLEGGIHGVFVEGNDVTERKRAEDALRAADLRKDEFLAILAHELRNPLAPIRHAAKISKMPHATAAQVKWSQEVIERQVEHMARLLDDLLEVSRITRGKLELRKERLVVNDAVASAVETARPLIEARGHELVVQIPQRPVEVSADPVRFAQVLGNLLTNATKYTDKGGRIRVSVHAADGNAVTTVEDNGIGIAPELLPHLFETFSQATSALDRSEGGLGIGLALVRGLVALHGGTVEGRSQGLGRGSEFVVTLPLLDAEVPADPANDGTADRDRGSCSPRRVLVVDDNRDSADGCATLLSLRGHEVRVAYSGEDAVTIADEFRPHVALLDIGMPTVNGYEVARRIRETDWGTGMLLVAVTGWGQLEDKRLAGAAGFDFHRAKPLDVDSLERLFADGRDA